MDTGRDMGRDRDRDINTHGAEAEAAETEVAATVPRARHGAAQARGGAAVAPCPLSRLPPSLLPSLRPSLRPRDRGSSLHHLWPSRGSAQTAQLRGGSGFIPAEHQSGRRVLLPCLLSSLPPAAMELPESQCKKVKLSNRVPSWVSGRAVRRWAGGRAGAGERGGRSGRARR